MNRFTLDEPSIAVRQATFRWRVNPPSNLYRVCEFTLRFPEEVEVERIPYPLWQLIALICLHTHWILLRPCRVELPFGLSPAETEFWYRLLEAEIATLEAHRGSICFDRDIELIGNGTLKETPPPLPPSSRCATAFSGGKDSLLQAGLLSEWTIRPVLVATTSPLPPLEDHTNPRRQFIFEEIGRRADVHLVEVKSDFRENWNNDFTWSQGYKLSLNEITDTFLYFSVLLAVSRALGIPHLFLASENEIQETVRLDSRIIQHPHCMYSIVTQRALQALIRPGGMRFSSLTSPLHSFQVQEILWRRYPRLRDLQYSCWKVKAGEGMCNRCSQCLRIALTALAMGEDPALIGADLEKVFLELKEWRLFSLDESAVPILPDQRVRYRLNSGIARSLRKISLWQGLKATTGHHPGRLIRPRTRSSFQAFRKLRSHARALNLPEASGFREGYLRHLDPLLREKAADVFSSYFLPESAEGYAQSLRQGDELAEWILEPLGVTAE